MIIEGYGSRTRINLREEKVSKRPIEDFHPSGIYRIASCGMDNTVKISSMKEFWTYVEKPFTWTDLPSKFPTKYVQFPSVDNAIVLGEHKMKEQSPGEEIEKERFLCGNCIAALLFSLPGLLDLLSLSKSPIKQTAMSFGGR
ncbi:hypothetical protein DITRI_Ditri01bG0170500 [Diplodiscus trichospermus]